MIEYEEQTEAAELAGVACFDQASWQAALKSLSSLGESTWQQGCA